jgi:hypothetical protein
MEYCYLGHLLLIDKQNNILYNGILLLGTLAAYCETCYNQWRFTIRENIFAISKVSCATMEVLYDRSSGKCERCAPEYFIESSCRFSKFLLLLLSHLCFSIEISAGDYLLSR